MKKVDYRTLRRIIKEEMAVLNEEGLTGELEDVEKVAKDVPETEASEYASALEQDIDFMKALKIQEQRLAKKMSRIKEAKRKLRSRILKGIDKE